jgi:hypothetical protein
LTMKGKIEQGREVKEREGRKEGVDLIYRNSGQRLTVSGSHCTRSRVKIGVKRQIKGGKTSRAEWALLVCSVCSSVVRRGQLSGSLWGGGRAGHVFGSRATLALNFKRPSGPSSERQQQTSSTTQRNAPQNNQEKIS